MADTLHTYTVWSNFSATDIACVRGEGPPRFVDGPSDAASRILLHRFEARSHAEACATYRRLMGWEPHRPATG